MPLKPALPGVPPQAGRVSVWGLPMWETADALALPLFTTWAIRTGRTLRPVPVSDLTAEELIDFWADDQLAAETGHL